MPYIVQARGKARTSQLRDNSKSDLGTLKTIKTINFVGFYSFGCLDPEGVPALEVAIFQALGRKTASAFREGVLIGSWAVLVCQARFPRHL
jgi:hypothetical protein